MKVPYSAAIAGLVLLCWTAVAAPSTHAARGAHAPAQHLVPHLATFTVADSLAAIRWAAGRWHISRYWLERVARCESGLSPYASNGVDFGLFQFLPGTYYGYAYRIGERRSYWNPWGAANVAAYMFHIGLSYEWSCR